MSRRTSFLFHSVALLTALTVVACGGPAPDTPAQTTTTSKPPAGAEAEHEHAPPHGGTLVEVGQEFGHIEFVLDRPGGRLTAYVLDGEAEQAVRVTHPVLVVDVMTGTGAVTIELAPVASALTGEKVGDASEFAVVRPELFKAGPIQGRVRELTMKGQTFRALEFALP